MTKEQYVRIFRQTHPGFFEGHEPDRLADDRIYEEMFLRLAEFSGDTLCIPLPDGVTFGYYQGDRDRLIEAVREVDADWPQWFRADSPVYCGFLRGELASFCLVEDMGTVTIDGVPLRIGGPGCVGTRPSFRRQGIGLAMVQRVTGILKSRGFDYSYIHYTGVARWYARLGYRTCLRWNRKGIL